MQKQQRGSAGVANWWAYRIPTAWCVLGVVVAFGTGAGLTALLSPGTPAAIEPDAQIAGVVTVVDEDGTSFCLTGDQDREQHCSEVYLPTGSVPLKVGEHVVVTIAMVPVPGGSQAVYVVTNRDPAPDDAEGASQ